MAGVGSRDNNDVIADVKVPERHRLAVNTRQGFCVVDARRTSTAWSVFRAISPLTIKSHIFAKYRKQVLLLWLKKTRRSPL